jgi:predicted nucleotidyltransferase
MGLPVMATSATEADAEFTALCEAVRRDPAVLGAVLTGSQAREGTATRWSDYDVWVVTADDTTSTIGARRTPALDVVVMPLAEFRTHGLPEFGSDFNRYTFVHARVLADTPDLIARLVARKATLGADEARTLAAGTLDAFTNSAYRACKNHRDGRAVEARLDAAEAVPFLLTHVFAQERRVRPFNKYLGWELARHPLAAPPWRADRLLPLLDGLLGPDWPPVLHSAFADVERLARDAGHGAVLDAWDEDLLLLRGERRPSYDETP